MRVSEVAAGTSFGQSVESFASNNGLSRAYVYKLIKKGLLRAVKSGSRTIILNQDGQAYFNSLKPIGEARNVA